jgi:RimJ/RimL family protein N-acetyltransferase
MAAPDRPPVVEISVPIETERLRLRPFVLGDLGALHSYESRPDVARYLYWGPRTESEVREALAGKISRTSIREEGDFLAFAIETKDDDVMVGDVVLEWISRRHRQGEIGYIVHPDHHGRGYATEACRPLLRFAFEEMGLHRVVGRLDARNTASARVLEKLGMRREAHLVENEWVKEEWQSEVVYAILDREWRALA